MVAVRAVRARSLLGAATSSLTWRFRGATRVTAIVKATFVFELDGRTPQRADPLPVLESDLAPRLGAVDVIVDGRAFSPQGRPVESLDVGIEVHRGSERLLEKRIRVVAGRDGVPPGPFVVAPLPPPPRGLGPVARPPLGAEPVLLPDEPDVNAFQAAPPDQRIAQLTGGEGWVLHHLHPDQARIEVPSPRAVGRAQLLGPSAPASGLFFPLVADRVTFDVSRRSMSVVWRGDLPIADLGSHEIVGWVEAGDAKTRSELSLAARAGMPLRDPQLRTAILERARENLGGTAEVSADQIARHRGEAAVPFLPKPKNVRAMPVGKVPAADKLGTGTVDLPPSPQPVPKKAAVDLTSTFMLSDEEVAAARGTAAIPFQSGPRLPHVPTGTLPVPARQIATIPIPARPVATEPVAARPLPTPTAAPATFAAAPPPPPPLRREAPAPAPTPRAGPGAWFEDIDPLALDVGDDLPEP